MKRFKSPDNANMNRNLTKTLIVAAAMLTLSGEVMISTAAAQSSARCERYARDVSWGRARGGALGGGARGAVGGAILGGILGGRRGARRGGALGAIIGGTSGAAKRNRAYRRAYRRCMEGRR